MPYKNRIRLPIMFTKPQFPTERNVFRLADGSSKVLSVIIRNTFEGSTDQLPEDWHRKLVVAMSHDEITIENERLMSKNFPVALACYLQGHFQHHSFSALPLQSTHYLYPL